MADNKNVEVNISGVIPKLKGVDSRYGNWFLIDENGEFSLDHTVAAAIWLVGGGCDGTAGTWNGNQISGSTPIPDTGTGTSYSGNGGDGGYVLTVMNVKIPKGQILTSVIAENNDKSGTSLNISGVTYKCNQAGGRFLKGGEGGNLPLPPDGVKYANQDDAELSYAGITGVETPYGYVGSSGGGGAVCNGQVSASNGIEGGIGAGSGTSHRKAGTDATNYGCGGGGGAICGQIAAGQEGGKGKQGCIIIAYTVEQKTLIVERHYTKKCTTTKNCTTNYATSQNSSHCCTNRSSCGCGSSVERFHPNGVYSAKYTDSLNINGDSMTADELIEKIETLEAENLAMLKRIQVLENERGIL